MGASAGGLEAFERFFDHMPYDSGAAFVIAQHLDPKRTSLMTELLARHTKMPVALARDGEPIVANRVYLIAPNASLTIEQGQLHVETPLTTHPSPAIDRLFRSLAEDQGANAICILLSGTGTDGTLGLEAVKEHGGLALEQAKHDSIPRSAIATGLVDHALPVEEMPGKIVEYGDYLRGLARSKGVDALKEEAAEQLVRICAILRTRTGHDFTRYKATTGKVMLERRQLDLRDVVSGAVEDHRASYALAKLGLDVQLPRAPVPVDADPIRISQVVTNLLGNARKFSDPGGAVTVRVVVDGARAVLSVRDEGIGIDAGMLGRLFQPFSQADRSLGRARGGLGLAVVKALVEAHGGTVDAKSEGIGRGAEFVIALPLAAGAAAKPARKDRKDGDKPKVKPRSVLVIEDHVDAAEGLRLLLQIEGHEVRVAHDGKTGIAEALQRRPDVILCDIGLPGAMDGYAVAKAFRAERKVAKAFLVALTGYGRPEDQRRAREAGFDLHLTKPVDPVRLREILEKLGSGSTDGRVR